MHAKLIHQAPDGQRTWAVIFDTGDEVMAGLRRFADENRLAASQFTAIGAFSRATLAYFDWPSRQYQEIPVPEQVEVLVLSGDIAQKDGKPAVHAHCVAGRRDGSTCGGHVLEGHVRPTLEVILTESPSYLKREFDPASGLALIKIGR